MASTERERDPFILDRPTAPRVRARDALICVFVAALLLLLSEGASIRNSGEKLDAGIQRTVVLAVGHPAGWVADRLPFAGAVDDVTATLSPDDDLSGPGGFESVSASAGSAAAAGAPAPVTADAFDPSDLGEKPVRLKALKTLLVTGDSLVQPLDVELARRLAPDGVRTERDAHLGTGISKTDLLDWGLLSSQQVRDTSPEAVVFFLGANEGFSIPGAGGKDVVCCGAPWAALYATRARRMMETYRRRGAARVYWLTLPLPRDPRRQQIARVVNKAIEVAAQPFRSQVRVMDMTEVFTPGNRFRAAMTVGGRSTIVRDADGIHLNDAGSRVAAGLVVTRLRADFEALG